MGTKKSSAKEKRDHLPLRWPLEGKGRVRGGSTDRMRVPRSGSGAARGVGDGAEERARWGPTCGREGELSLNEEGSRPEAWK